jgi:hypothetical protein
MNFIDQINQLFEERRVNSDISSIRNDKEIEFAVEKIKYPLNKSLQYKNIISDCLARLLNDNETKCVSVYLHLKNAGSDKDFLEELYFCSKSSQNEDVFREKVLNLLNYCTNTNRNGDQQRDNNIQILSDSMKKKIIGKLIKFQNTSNHFDLCIKYNLKNKIPINELDFLKNLILGMYKYNHSVNSNANDEKNKKIALYYTLIIVFDLLALPSLFEYCFSINSSSQGLNLNNKIKCFTNQENDTNQHPDSVIAYKISTLVSTNSLDYNRYVGVSLMPCLYCKLFLESFKFDFRGLTSTIYKLWKIPTRNENENERFNTITTFFDTFNKKLQDHIEKLKNNQELLSDRMEECCQRTCIHMSDDIDVFFEFLKRQQAIINNAFFSRFNQNEKNQVIDFSNLIKVLYEKRSFCV